MKLFMTGIRHQSCSLPPNLDNEICSEKVFGSWQSCSYLYFNFSNLSSSSYSEVRISRIFTRGGCLGCLIEIYGPTHYVTKEANRDLQPQENEQEQKADMVAAFFRRAAIITSVLLYLKLMGTLGMVWVWYNKTSRLTSD